MKKFVWLLVLPLMAAAVALSVSAQIYKPTKCPPVDIPGYTVLIPNPDDCSSYFSCSNGVPILKRCPDGLWFNPKLDVCDWPQNVECNMYGITTPIEVECADGPEPGIACPPAPGICTPLLPC